MSDLARFIVGELLRAASDGLRRAASAVDPEPADETECEPTPPQRPLTPEALAMMPTRSVDRAATMRPPPLAGSLASRAKEHRR